MTDQVVPDTTQYPEIAANPKAVDGELYAAFRSCKVPSYLDALAVPEAIDKAAREKFKKNRQAPALVYPHASLSAALTSLRQLDAMAEFVKDNATGVLQDLYLAAVADATATARLVECIATLYEGRWTQDVYARYYMRANEAAFGRPSELAFNYVLTQFGTAAEQLLAASEDLVVQAASRVLELLPEPTASITLTLPSPEVVTEARTRLLFRRGVWDFIDLDKDYTSEDMAEAFRQMLHAMGYDHWKVQVEGHDKSVVTTSWPDTTIFIPPGKIYPGKRVVELAAHELGHVESHEVGLAGRCLLLGIGFPGYDSPEEGAQMVAEQSVVATPGSSIEEFAHLDRLLAVGLALGLDGTPRNFAQVFAILEPIKQMDAFARGKSESVAFNNAWMRNRRTFRGGDAETPGVCLIKDHGYTEYNIRCWMGLEQFPWLNDVMDVGKFDRTSVRDLGWLHELGILADHGVSTEQYQAFAKSDLAAIA